MAYIFCTMTAATHKQTSGPGIIAVATFGVIVLIAVVSIVVVVVFLRLYI